MKYIGCDWGTSNFRLRWVSPPHDKEFRSDDGVAKLASLPGDRAERFRSVLEHGLEQLGAPSHLPVIISGMAGSSIGWKELPYAQLPFHRDGRNVLWAALGDHVCLISGLRTDDDVMRGEETQILGLFERLGSQIPDHAIAVLPGTHSKHVELRDGAIVGFRTFMTGEAFDLFSQHSVLKHSVDAAAELQRDAFTAGVQAVLSQPLLSVLFKVRTRQLLRRVDAVSNTSFLSGILIGSELSALAAARIPIIVAAGEHLRRAYEWAAQAIGMPQRFTAVDSSDLSTLGQRAVLRHFLAQRDSQGS